MDRPQRKPNRLSGYDYASHGAYFVTICTANREPLFWEMDNHGGNHKYGNNKPGDNNQRSGNHVGAANSRPQATLYLSPAGRVVEHAIQDISAHYPAVSVDKYVIMPNHVHAIIRIETTGEDGRDDIRPYIVDRYRSDETMGIQTTRPTHLAKILLRPHHPQ